jgi:type II secretory ATPase GspE/PulE/Tfp pilus assembly ATPase PilB-like protein
VTRLVDLGVEPYMAAATLQGVLAQRLVRRVCLHCGEWRDAGEAVHALGPVLSDSTRIRVGAGCAVCRNTGFRGRVGIFEFLDVDSTIRTCIASAPDAQQIARIAGDRGMRPMRDDGRSKVRDGLTTPEEVLRAIQD